MDLSLKLSCLYYLGRKIGREKDWWRVGILIWLMYRQHCSLRSSPFLSKVQSFEEEKNKLDELRSRMVFHWEIISYNETWMNFLPLYLRASLVITQTEQRNRTSTRGMVCALKEERYGFFYSQCLEVRYSRWPIICCRFFGADNWTFFSSICMVKFH